MSNSSQRLLNPFADWGWLKQIVWGGVFSTTLLSLPASTYALTVRDIPPRLVNSGWVSDTADLLSPQAETKINHLVVDLETKNGVEVVVVTVPETKPSVSPKAFATELFNHWDIGKEGQDNGVLLLISKADRRVEIETGYGVEAWLPDAKVGNIINQDITPRFKQGDFDGGTFAGTQAVVQSLRQSPAQAQSNPQAAQEGELLRNVIVPSIVLLGLIVLVGVYYCKQREDLIEESDNEAREPYPTRKPVISDSNKLREKESNIEQSQAIGQDETNSASSDGRRPVGDHRRLSPNTSEQSNFLGTGYSSSELTAAATWAAFVSSSSNYDTDSDTRSESGSARSDSSSSDSGSSYSDSSSSSSSNYSDSSSSSSDFGGGSSGGGGAGDSW